MDKQLHILGLFSDLAEACGVINHEILLYKLEYYGKRGTIKAWIESYLSYLSQFIEIFKTDNTGRNEKVYKSACKEIPYLLA